MASNPYRHAFELDPEQDQALAEQLAALAKKGQKSATIRAALYAYLVADGTGDELRPVLDEIARMRVELLQAIRRATLDPTGPAAPADEDRALGAALDAQLDDFFEQ